jgi:L-ascorbate 6-phosphate lactonase
MTIHTGARLIEEMNSLKVEPGGLALWWLGQMGVALKGDSDTIVYIDPCLSEIGLSAEGFEPGIFERMFPPPVDPGQISNADWVLCSHEHFDHTDPLTVGPLAAASPEAQFVVTGWSLDIMKDADVALQRVTVAKAQAMLELKEGLQVIPVPAAHYHLEQDPDKGHRWLGFLLVWNGVRLYHAGDTIIYPGYLDIIKSLAPVDIAIIPTNGRDGIRDGANIVGNMWPKEALYVAELLQAQVLIPGHNDLYRGNRIPAALFLEEWERSGGRQRFRILQPGELFYYYS